MSSEFNLEIFVTTPSLQALKSLKTSQLQQIASSTRKGEMSCLIKEHLINEELVSEDEIDELYPAVVDNNVVELKCLELED